MLAAYYTHQKRPTTFKRLADDYTMNVIMFLIHSIEVFTKIKFQVQLESVFFDKSDIFFLVNYFKCSILIFLLSEIQTVITRDFCS